MGAVCTPHGIPFLLYHYVHIMFKWSGDDHVRETFRHRLLNEG